jgi:hypothetical protein
MQDLPPAKRHPKDEIGRLRTRVAELERHLARQAQALHELPVAIWTAHDPECRRITGNRYADEVIMRVPRGANISRSAAGGGAVSYRVLRNAAELAPRDMPAQKGRDHW